MTKIPCETVRDLIPLVLDGAASQSSEAIVSEHCASCAECAALIGNRSVVLPPADPQKQLRRLKKTLFFASMPVLLLGILFGVMLMDDFGMFYNFIIFPAIGAAAYFLLRGWCWMAPAVTFLGIFLRYLFTTNGGILFGSYEGFLTGLYSGVAFGTICVVFVGIGLLIGWFLHWGIGQLRKGRRLWLKLLAIAAALSLIFFCCSATFSFTGNPLTMLMTHSLAENYVKEQYPHLELKVTDVSYNFKFAQYSASIVSPESPDVSFQIMTKNGMHVDFDTYENSVAKRQTMFNRLCNEYQQIIDPLIATVPGMEQHSSYFFWNPSEEEYESYDYGQFMLNAPLDRELLHKMGGELLVRTYTSEDITPENLARLMKETHTVLKEAGWDAPSYSGSIESRQGGWIYSDSYTGEELDALTLEELTEEIRIQNE